MPPIDLLRAIRDAASELTQEERAAPVLVGVSGGPDSLSLLHALWRWRAEGGPAPVAVHLDHRLRPESADEAAQVAEWCAGWGIPFIGRAAAFDRPPDANIEQVAREARYACFAEAAAESGARVLALAHHADDQAETLLLHLLRGSGLAGLAGMPVVRREGDLLDPICAARGVARPAVWRPLLTVGRATILTYCARWGLAPFHDPSNNDTTLRRNAIRHLILPLLEEHFPAAGGALARNAALLAADEDYLRRATAEALERCVRREPGALLIERAIFRAEPLALQRRILRGVWGEVRGVAATVGLDADVLESARVAVVAGRTGAALDLPGEALLLLDRDTAAVGPRATLAATLRGRLGLPQVDPDWVRSFRREGRLPLDEGWSIETGGMEAADRFALHIPEGLIEGGALVFRTWRPGDRVTLAGGRHRRKLQDWFTDRHLPGYARHQLPLLVSGNLVLWIVGLAAFPPLDDAPQELTALAGGVALRLLYNSSPVEPVRRG